MLLRYSKLSPFCFAFSQVAQILKNKDLEMKVQIAQARSLADMMSTEKVSKQNPFTQVFHLLRTHGDHNPTPQAIVILKSLYDEGKTTEAILSLYGRCFKVYTWTCESEDTDRQISWYPFPHSLLTGSGRGAPKCTRRAREILGAGCIPLPPMPFG